MLPHLNSERSMQTGSDGKPLGTEGGPPKDRTVTDAADLAPLTPRQPPGRVTRKARHYVPQIVKLRDQGYTLEAIQSALADVGVTISLSTVRREAMRPVPTADWFGPPVTPAPALAPASALASTSRTPAPSAVSPLSGTPGPSTGKDLAAAYVSRKTTNELARSKEKP